MKFGAFAALCLLALFAPARAQNLTKVMVYACEATGMLLGLVVTLNESYPDTKEFACPLYQTYDKYCAPDSCALSCDCKADAGTSPASGYVDGQTEELPPEEPQLQKSKSLGKKSKGANSKSKHAKSKHQGKNKHANKA